MTLLQYNTHPSLCVCSLLTGAWTMGNMDVVHQTLPSPCLKVQSATSQNILVLCFGVKNHLKGELSVPSGLCLQAWPGPSTSWLTCCSRQRRGSRRLRCEIFLGSDFPGSDLSLRSLLLCHFCWTLTCFFPFFYYYVTKFHKSQRWEVFCFFGFIFALWPQKWQKSHFHTVKNQMHDGRSLCCVKLLRLIKKSVFYSRYFVVSILPEMRIHTESPAGGNRGQFPQPIKFNKCI